MRILQERLLVRGRRERIKKVGKVGVSDWMDQGKGERERGGWEERERCVCERQRENASSDEDRAEMDICAGIALTSRVSCH